MSTRSGKRIHSSPHNEIIGDTDISHGEIKTRSKRNKAYEEDSLTVKKQKHYVKYPSEETTDDVVNDIKNNKSRRKSKRNTLKERNAYITESEGGEQKHPTKQTRRTKANNEIENHILLNHDNQYNNHEKKDKKRSKKKERTIEIDENGLHTEQNSIAVPKKKSNKRKIKMKSGSIIVEDVDNAEEQCKELNGSRMSVDSFHSAAGSPKANNDDEELVKANNKSTPKTNKDNDKVCAISPIVGNSSSKKNSKRRCNLSSVCLSVPNQKLKDTNNEQRNEYQDNAVNVSNEMQTEDTERGEKQRTSLNGEASINNGTIDKIEDSKVSSSQKLKNSNEKKKKRPKKQCDSKLHNTHTAEAKTKLNMTFDEKEISFNKLPKHDTTMEKADNISFGKTEKINATFEKEQLDTTFDKSNKLDSTFNKSEIVNTAFDKINTTVDIKEKTNTTFDKIEKLNTTFEKPDKTNTTFDKIEKLNTTFEKPDKTNTTFDKIEKLNTTFEKPYKTNTTFDKIEKLNTTFEKPDKTNTTFDKIEKINTTFDKTEINNPTFNRTEKINTTLDKNEKTNTFDKHNKTDTTFETTVETNTSIEKTKKSSPFDNQANSRKIESKGSTLEVKTKSTTDTSFYKISNDTSNDSLISSDVSKGSHISLTSDESHSENILNNTPLLVESSMEEGNNDSKRTSSSTIKVKAPITPLKREGTFTKDSPEVPIAPKIKTSLNRTPTRRKSLPSPGCTPFPLNKSSSKDKTILNATRSIEKSRRSSLAELLPRSTKVMFCSPSNNPVAVSQMKKKIIKSSLKGSNKSFIFEDSGSSSPVRLAGRKRSQTQAAAEPRAKRSRLLIEPPPERARARTVSATGRILSTATPTKKADTPTQTKDAKPVRTKLPNFAALHQKQFAKMESLDECQERKAKRARQLLTPNGAVAFLERISPKENQVSKPPEPVSKKTETPPKSKPTLNPGYSRFGFKLNFDSNPFSFTAKNTEVKKAPAKLSRQVTMPSLTGATLTRKEAAKQMIMREKSFTGKRDVTRTVIKGVRTNRRFELQMKMRNING